MSKYIADRVQKIEEPQTILMSKKARELIAKGIDVINLSLGEPDFDTPEHIKAAAIKAIQDNFSHYTPVAGIPELREAIAQKFKTDNLLNYAADEIVVSTGAKQAIMNVFMAVVNPGDEVLIPTPYWVSYSEMAKLVDGVPKFIKASLEQHYKITPEQLEAAITERSKLFIFSSPCNPTGSVYSHTELMALAEVFARHPQVLVISDEIYEFIQFRDQHHSIGAVEAMANRVITINGFSKGFAMTGWRLGYLGAPKSIATACEKIQAQFTSAANGITQKAALAALTGDKSPSLHMVEAFKRRRTIVKNGLSDIPGLICNEPEGAFYFFPNIGDYIGQHGINNATDFCMYLLNEAHVSCVTGEAFGDEHCFRISYAASDELLEKACDRIRTGLEKLSH